MVGKRTGRGSVATLERRLLEFAASFPEAWIDHPWGENVMKVRRKVFLFLGVPDERLTLSVKLPHSRFEALLLPFTEPTGYGLGKSGWVTASFEEGAAPPFGLLCAWIDESYRAVAPRTLVRRLDAGDISKAKAAPRARWKVSTRAAAKKARKSSSRSSPTKTSRRKKA